MKIMPLAVHILLIKSVSCFRLLMGPKMLHETAAQIQFWISLFLPNTTRIAINWATLDNLLQQKKVSQNIYLHIYLLLYLLPVWFWFLKFKSKNNTPLLIFTIWTSTRRRRRIHHENICGLNIIMVSITVYYRVPIWILSTNHRITSRWVFWSAHSATIWEFGSSAFLARGTMRKNHIWMGKVPCAEPKP